MSTIKQDDSLHAKDMQERLDRLSVKNFAARQLIAAYREGKLTDQVLVVVLEHLNNSIESLMEALTKDSRPWSVTLPPGTAVEHFVNAKSDIAILPHGVEYKTLGDTLLPTPQDAQQQVGKYGSVERFASKLRPDEPWFGIRAQDALAVPALEAYLSLAAGKDRDTQFLHSMGLLIDAMKIWQEKNQEFVKLPD